MPIAYVAQTRDHLLMLDEQGVCIHVHLRNPRQASEAGRAEQADRLADAAGRCLGAQYVAALDISVPGFLGHVPTIGAPMLFAKADAAGKISLVRTGPIERFETRGSGEYEVTAAVRELLPSHRRSITPAIRYMRDEDVEEEDEPTMRIRPGVPYAPAGPTTRRSYSSRAV